MKLGDYRTMTQTAKREPEPVQPLAASRRAGERTGAPWGRFPLWLVGPLVIVMGLFAYLLLSRGAIALARQPEPGDLWVLAPTARVTETGTVPAPATVTATPTVTPTEIPPSQGTPASPKITPTSGPTATMVVNVEGTTVPVIRQQPPLPTPTLPPPLPTEEPVSGNPHGDYTVTTSACAGCHRAHSAQGLALRKAWPEETLCFSCHGASGPGTDVEAAFTATTNTATRFFKHDPFATNGVHRIGESQGSDFGGANRHVECEDCHDPHASARGITGAPVLQREMDRISGVDPVWIAPGAPVGSVWLDEAEREYQVCFKCHSSFTELPSYAPDGWDGSTYVPDGLRKLTYTGGSQVPDHRDLAQEFNPYNDSFHPVVTQGRNRSIPAGSFVNGWSVDSLVYCSDCHTNAAPATGGEGPHGSPLLHLLGGSEEYQTANPDDASLSGSELCFQCHDAEDYIGRGSETNFARNRSNLHRKHTGSGSCYLCHDTHGSEQLHLLNLDSSIELSSDTYFLPGYDGLPTNSQTFWQISPDGSEKTCWLVCHGHDHSRSAYPNVGD